MMVSLPSAFSLVVVAPKAVGDEPCHVSVAVRKSGFCILRTYQRSGIFRSTLSAGGIDQTHGLTVPNFSEWSHLDVSHQCFDQRSRNHKW